jgi:hypothetical protein
VGLAELMRMRCRCNRELGNGPAPEPLPCRTRTPALSSGRSAACRCRGGGGNWQAFCADDTGRFSYHAPLPSRTSLQFFSDGNRAPWTWTGVCHYNRSPRLRRIGAASPGADIHVNKAEMYGHTQSRLNGQGRIETKTDVVWFTPTLRPPYRKGTRGGLWRTSPESKSYEIGAGCCAMNSVKRPSFTIVSLRFPSVTLARPTGGGTDVPPRPPPPQSQTQLVIRTIALVAPPEIHCMLHALCGFYHAIRGVNRLRAADTIGICSDPHACTLIAELANTLNHGVWTLGRSTPR